jgi:hypothetical protein
MATVYVAGKYWAEGQNLAVKLGFGLIQENGIDLKVEDPRPRPEVETLERGLRVLQRIRDGPNVWGVTMV